MSKLTVIPLLIIILTISISLSSSSASNNANLNAPSCGSVTQKLGLCLSFLLNSKASQPSPPCCDGAKAIGGQVKSQGDRGSVCQCLKQSLSLVGSYDPNRIPLIPKKCGLSLNLPPIDRNTDCSKAATYLV